MNDKVYAITDLQGYIQEMRQAAADSLATNCEDNLDEYINLNQMINLVNKNCVGYDDQDRPLLNEDANNEIYESTVIWIHNVGLAKLAAKDLIQCAWDDNANEMVFWANPEITGKKSNVKPNKRRSKKKDTGS